MILTLFLFSVSFLIIKHKFYWRANYNNDTAIPGGEKISHRGLRLAGPENTVSGYVGAVEDGFNWIELDVLSTKDNVIVCSHNFDLERETNCKGYINQVEYSDLKSCYCVSKSNILSNEKIPTLISVLQTLPKDVGVNVEIKTNNIFDFKTARAFNEVIQILSERPNIVSSFNPLIVLYFRLFYNGVPVGFILESKKYIKFVDWIHPHFLIPRADMLNKKLYKFAEHRKLKILTWTVNNNSAINWCLDNNILGIMTDLRYKD